MRKILLFVKNKPAELIIVNQSERNIDGMYPQLYIRNLPVEIVFVTFSNGKSCGISCLGSLCFACGNRFCLRKIAPNGMKYF